MFVSLPLFDGVFLSRHCGLLFCADCCSKESLIPLLGYEEEPVRVCNVCFPLAKQGGKHYQEAPEWKPIENAEPEWQRPPSGMINPEASAPTQNFVNNDNGAAYPELYK